MTDSSMIDIFVCLPLTDFIVYNNLNNVLVLYTFVGLVFVMRNKIDEIQNLNLFYYTNFSKKSNKVNC